MTIGMFAFAAARASTRSPRYAESALMPIGAMPNGAAYVWPKSVASVERCETSTSTRGMNPSSSKAARLSRAEALSSTEPATYSKIGRGRRRRAARSKSSSDRMRDRLDKGARL